MGDVKRPTEGSVIAKIPLGDRVSDIVTNPHNSVACAALRDSIAVISSLHKISCVIPIGGHPRALTIGADGSRLYAAGYGDSVSVIDISDHRVGVIPGACCVRQVDTADGALIYAAGNAADGGRISVIDEGAPRSAPLTGSTAMPLPISRPTPKANVHTSGCPGAAPTTNTTPVCSALSTPQPMQRSAPLIWSVRPTPSPSVRTHPRSTPRTMTTDPCPRSTLLLST